MVSFSVQALVVRSGPPVPTRHDVGLGVGLVLSAGSLSGSDDKHVGFLLAVVSHYVD